jgi:L-aminopeptidase/D-esterase-like protein
VTKQHLWVVYDYGYPSIPGVKRYVLVRKAPSGKGYIVMESGGKKHLREAQHSFFCETEAEAKETLLARIAAKEKYAKEYLKKLADAASKGMGRVTFVSPERPDDGQVGLD